MDEEVFTTLIGISSSPLINVKYAIAVPSESEMLIELTMLIAYKES